MTWETLFWRPKVRPLAGGQRLFQQCAVGFLCSWAKCRMVIMSVYTIFILFTVLYVLDAIYCDLLVTSLKKKRERLVRRKQQPY